MTEPLGPDKISLMPDVFTIKKRSEVMSLIKSRGNRDTEQKMVSIFREYGVSGWRRGHRLAGKPDFVFRAKKIALFVDGCFWHGCRWHCRLPKSRVEFWHPKLARNKTRDQTVNRFLKSRGWRVIRVWEHSLRRPEKVVHRIQAMLAPEDQKR